jgi:hypothetical protein
MEYKKDKDGTFSIIEPNTGMFDRHVREEVVVVNKYVEKFLHESDFSNMGNGFGSSVSREVWCYWGQGVENAPNIVKSCIAYIKKRNQDRVVRVLTDDTIKDFVEIPDYIKNNKNITKTLFSDILRVELLKKYGGTWIDATCLPTTSVTNLFNKVFDSDDPESYQKSNFFAFTSGNFLSSWFLMSSKDHVIPTLLSKYLAWYFKETDKPHHYFMFHLAFRALYLQHASFRRAWDRTYRMSSKKAHLLQKNLCDSYNENKYKQLLNESPVHKLTYKINDSEIAEDSYMRYIADIKNVR